MRLKITALLLAVVVVSATLGASAYTTGSLTRSSSVDVVSDDAGLIGLTDGTSGDLVYQNTDGQLAIDFAQGGATGANTNATFELGNPSDPTNATAFNITNQDATAHDLSVSYTGAGATGDSTNAIEFQIYDSTGTSVGTVSEESTSATINGVGSGETLYVVIVVDTTGLSSADDLSGTLEVSA